jgi:tetratricopeptide (TPR) repeat protein
VKRQSSEGGMQVHALNFELNSDDGSIYYHRAETYEKQGRMGDAIRDYQRALEMEPESLGFLEDRIAQLQEQVHER